MTLSRRQLLQLALAVWVGAGASAAEEEWIAECRRWMQVLIPPDAHTPGADVEAVWRRLEQVVHERPEVAAWLRGALGELKALPSPRDDRELEALLDRGPGTASALIKLHVLLAENYYATREGWADIGLLTPPQPNGYRMDALAQGDSE